MARLPWCSPHFDGAKSLDGCEFDTGRREGWALSSGHDDTRCWKGKETKYAVVCLDGKRVNL